jgi:TM2 domain-containing membrane protein YozV
LEQLKSDSHSVPFGYFIWLFSFTGAHRFYMGKWISGIIWPYTGGLFTLGWLYDFWTLNQNISEQNQILVPGSR